MRYILLTLLIIGCVKPLTSAQIAEKQKQLISADESQCKSYGFKKGTDAFANCRLQIEQTRQQQVTQDKQLSIMQQQQGQADTQYWQSMTNSGAPSSKPVIAGQVPGY